MTKATKRQSPDKPLGLGYEGEEEDFYAKQRAESPDGMTPAERDQHQKAAPGSLGQTDAAGDKQGDPDIEQSKPTSQSK